MSEEENQPSAPAFSADQQRLVDRIAADARREGARSAEQKLIGSLGERFDKLEAKIGAPAVAAPEPVRPAPAVAQAAPAKVDYRTTGGLQSVFALQPHMIDSMSADQVREMFEREVSTLRSGQPKRPSTARKGGR